MTYGSILAALADPTRRAVLDRLRGGPLPVGKIAKGLPVTRPAVSQHLKILREAGLVSVEGQGTRNIYALVPGGAAPLTDWLGDLRATPVAHGPSGGLLRHLDTRLSPAEAWQLFCEDLAIWWPVARVSFSARTEGALPQAVVLEPVAGGRLREVLFDGTEGIWAHVVEVRAPHDIRFDWHLGAETPTPVRVTISPDGGGSRLTVSYSAEPMGEMWDAVLDRFAATANSSMSNF